MTDAEVAESDWTRLGTHKGKISSLVWSPGGTLFSASFDGEIRRWGERYEIVRPTGTDSSDAVFSLAWSSSGNQLIASAGGELTVYLDGKGDPVAISDLPSPEALRCNPAGDCLAVREVEFPNGSHQARFKLRIRKFPALAEPALLDSNIFASPSWHYDLAWHPTRPLLAVLFDSEIKFASPITRRIFDNTWWVGPYSNAIAWISDDELAVAFGDANVRIYSWPDNEPSFGSDHRLRTKAVLEAHEASVSAISRGVDGQMFVTADLSGHIHVWSAHGQHLGGLLAPADDLVGPTILAVHPDLPILALARSSALYQTSLEAFLSAPVPPRASSDAKADGETLLSRLLRRAEISPPERLTSDAIAERWMAGQRPETSEEEIGRTLRLRRIGELTRNLDLVAAEAITLLWAELDHKEMIAFENADLASPPTDDHTPEAERVRRLLREVVVGLLASTEDRKRHLALCAYSALSYIDRSSSRELSASSAYSAALDDLRDGELRPELKRFRISANALETVSQVADILAGVTDTLRGMLDKLGQGEKNATTPEVAPKAKVPVDAAEGANDPSQIKDMIVIGALQEVEAVRERLLELGYPAEEHDLGGRMVFTFRIETRRRGSVVVGVMFALAKGKTEMKALLEAVYAHSRAEHVVMVGMMAGIKKKSKLLDVLIPFTIYDVSAIGTKNGRFIAEPEAGNMDRRLHHWTAGISGIEFHGRPVAVTSHKKTVTFAAKIDDLTHKLAQAALSVDPENVVGLEMEGSALIEMQSRHFGSRYVAYLMIKGVADYAGERPDASEAESLKKIPSLMQWLANPDPTGDADLKRELQREATRRALVVALELLKKVPARTTEDLPPK